MSKPEVLRSILEKAICDEGRTETVGSGWQTCQGRIDFLDGAGFSRGKDQGSYGTRRPIDAQGGGITDCKSRTAIRFEEVVASRGFIDCIVDSRNGHLVIRHRQDVLGKQHRTRQQEQESF